jgi:hypothetical protein
VPEDESQPKPAREGTFGTEEDWDKFQDVDQAYAGRLNKNSGHGTLRDGMGGYARLRRPAWDALWRLQRAGALTPQDLSVVVALVLRAGYRPARLGVVLGNQRELSDALGVRRQAVKDACAKAEELRLVDELYLDNGKTAGWRFREDVYWWLTSTRAKPMPAALTARLRWRTARSVPPCRAAARRLTGGGGAALAERVQAARRP